MTSKRQFTDDFLYDVRQKIKEAKEKYPEPNPNFKALISEIGELAEALIDLERYDDNVYDECVDIACVAHRIAEQADGNKQSEP